uniref:Uncharacterized protein n=1 Tax=viral metagenome TaxID=1070528 RepID=A0A6C0BNI8_9ZZZZ
MSELCSSDLVSTRRFEHHRSMCKMNVISTLIVDAMIEAIGG